MEDVNTDIAEVIPVTTLEGLFIQGHSGSFDKQEAAVKDLINQGHSATQFINQLHYIVIENEKNTLKSVITEKRVKVDTCLADDADEHLQLMSPGRAVM